MSLTLTDSRAISRIVARYQQRFPRAITRALNRATTSAHAKMGTLCANDLGLPVRVVKATMRVEKATEARPVARIIATGKRIPLYQFRARGPYPSRGKGRGVTARLPGGAGRYPHAFIARMPSGHVGVFERSSSKSMRVQKATWRHRRQAIRELRGPSLPKVFEKFIPEGLSRAEESLRTNLLHELRFAGASLAE